MNGSALSRLAPRDVRVPPEQGASLERTAPASASSVFHQRKSSFPAELPAAQARARLSAAVTVSVGEAGHKTLRGDVVVDESPRTKHALTASNKDSGTPNGRSSAADTTVGESSSVSLPVEKPSDVAPGLTTLEDLDGFRANRGVFAPCEPRAEVAQEWKVGLRGGSDDDVELGEADEGGGSHGELEAFASALRKDFESNLLATAKAGVKAASEKATKAGRLRLAAHRTESAREIRQLEDEGSRLKEQILDLRTANDSLIAKAEAFAENMSALRCRTSKCSTVARCLTAWRTNATRARLERSKQKTAEEHARLKLTTRTFHSWRAETRRGVNTRGRKAADLKLHAISKEIVERYEAELSALRANLDEANTQIAVEKARQREMEEGMRRTLLRGMSAMEMEAMKLMTDARGAGEELLGWSGSTAGTGYSSRAPSSILPRAVPAHLRIPEDCPRPLVPPKPTAPSSR